ncbi:MAG: DUF4124 domain-containing protein [Betaproteobacteria bacterium]|nr:DUF4124 domain-containing protein [Betaproteobacteria bacterium]
MFKAILVLAAALAPLTAHAQIIKCVGKDGKTYVGSTLPPQCAGQSINEMNKQGMVVKRSEAALTPEQRAAKEAEGRIAKEKEEEVARKEKEEMRKNKALLSTYGSEKDIEVARSRALADNEAAVKQTLDKVTQIEKTGINLRKELEFYKGKNKPPANVTQNIQNNEIDLKAQQELLSAKRKDVEAINAKYDEDKRRYLELTDGPVAAPTAKK